MTQSDPRPPPPGDGESTDELLGLVYDDLRRRAGGILGPAGGQATLNPTALVHEAYARLADRTAPWASRAHFLNTAARAMRQILVDHARAYRTRKRGGDRQRVTVTLDGFSDPSSLALDLVELDDALRDLHAMSEELARVVDLRFLAGLTVEEAAGVLGVTSRTVKNRWRAARAWLRDRLDE